MGGLLRRRPVRHVAIGIAPLLVIAVGLLILLTARFSTAAAPLRAATATAEATVVRGDLGADGKTVELRWTDSRGEAHTSQVRVPEVSNVHGGGKATVRYVPDDPSRIFVNGDETSLRLRDLAFEIFAVTIVLLGAVLLTIVHVLRRLRAERRPATPTVATYARSKRGLLQRSWLILEEGGREWWIPVHWEEQLAGLLAKTPAKVHGRPMLDRVLVIDVGGGVVWQSGRKRSGPPPKADVITATTPWSKSAERRVEATPAEPPPTGRLSRQFRGDAVVIVVAPLLGVLWAYLDGSGQAGFIGASVLMLGVLFWVPAIFGSDPT
ncbi:MAG TPA: DUF3592 domain-containing protein [Mycobacteriales bacterium]|nr:DUF3592 domain-containing protein [Mycobacteriales bacterium]